MVDAFCSRHHLSRARRPRITRAVVLPQQVDHPRMAEVTRPEPHQHDPHPDTFDDRYPALSTGYECAVVRFPESDTADESGE
ncbi:hypothetical protein SAMN04487820_103323 [Actinopolyspora mzabensis]|uniref:Uncharacterized protein n=1 Tax=Actinopolyspora mzabensis TaxID=995066 RepID=A0A1G8YA68_ACTMZ|nr:hypothetical protein SAMN04487820_103323 [Actinopolyspora mzabensis]